MHITQIQSLIDKAGSARAQGKREPAAEAIILNSFRELQPACKPALSGKKYRATVTNDPVWLKFEETGGQAA